MPAETRKW
jgi:hydroxyacylglutathione hydrolase